ncbi:Methyltransferase-like protein [Actinidia chinensis var. chinensis]|uniref:Methyltransferase-like protein n=1 Tax=Actinidia chinensis var. chinensis TaxID=1590841 RepID=A0A2R6R3E7_ACTCC|nr:Methyltransferase-like protein [Actinidia chinensis var. chinensis]
MAESETGDRISTFLKSGGETFVRNLRSDGCSPEECEDLLLPSVEQSFVELGSVWQAPLYEITLNFPQCSEPTQDGGSPIVQSHGQKVIPMFNNLIVNETSGDAEAEFLNSKFIMPRKSCFYMRNLIVVLILYWWIHHGKIGAPIKN